MFDKEDGQSGVISHEEEAKRFWRINDEITRMSVGKKESLFQCNAVHFRG